MSDPLNILGSIWYHSEPLEIPNFPNQYFDWYFFCHFLQQGSSSEDINCQILKIELTYYEISRSGINFSFLPDYLKMASLGLKTGSVN